MAVSEQGVDEKKCHVNPLLKVQREAIRFGPLGPFLEATAAVATVGWVAQKIEGRK